MTGDYKLEKHPTFESEAYLISSGTVHPMQQRFKQDNADKMRLNLDNSPYKKGSKPKTFT